MSLSCAGGRFSRPICTESRKNRSTGRLSPIDRADVYVCLMRKWKIRENSIWRAFCWNKTAKRILFFLLRRMCPLGTILSCCLHLLLLFSGMIDSINRSVRRRRRKGRVWLRDRVIWIVARPIWMGGAEWKTKSVLKLLSVSKSYHRAIVSLRLDGSCSQTLPFRIYFLIWHAKGW